MKIYISKQNMRSNSKRAVNNIAVVLFLLLLSALTSVSAYQVGDTVRDCAACPEMVVLPAGKFTIGSPEGERGRDDDEGPQHQVTISKPFAVSKYEVTVGQYAEFVRETKHKTGNCLYVQDGSLRDDDDFNWRNPNFKQSNNHPVVCISWDDASTYVHWLSVKTGHEYRLLTEAEWEYAARAGTTTAYHFGRMILGNQANYDRNNEGAVAVGSYPSNAFGLHDMHGNVWEWVEDCWHDDYTGAPTNGNAWLSGCDDADVRVLRGGSWDVGPQGLRSAVRFLDVASSRENYIGFRVARTLTP